MFVLGKGVLDMFKFAIDTVCVCACVRACVRACVCVCACVRTCVGVGACVRCEFGVYIIKICLRNITNTISTSTIKKNTLK